MTEIPRNSRVIIRQAKRSDISRIIDLATDSMSYSLSPFRETSLEAAKHFRKKDLQQLYNLFNHPNFGVFVAEDEGKFIGHVIVFIGSAESISGENQGWVIDLSLVRSHWGKGIARKLTWQAEEFVRQKGLKAMGLAVTTGNKRAVRFYERMGYHEERKKMIKILRP